jgi:hypothetical protein
MKHLLNGVALAAALAIAVPAWAQNAPMSPSAPKAAAPAATMPAAARQKHRAVRHHATRHHGRMARSGDSMTQELNREELSRLQGAPSMPMQRPMASPSPHAGPMQGQPMAPPR